MSETADKIKRSAFFVAVLPVRLAAISIALSPAIFGAVFAYQGNWILGIGLMWFWIGLGVWIDYATKKEIRERKR